MGVQVKQTKHRNGLADEQKRQRAIRTRFGAPAEPRPLCVSNLVLAHVELQVLSVLFSHSYAAFDFFPYFAVDNSSRSGRSRDLSSHLRVPMVSPSSVPTGMMLDGSSARSGASRRTAQSDPGSRTRRSDFIPSTPKRSSSFEDDDFCPLRDFPLADTATSRWGATTTTTTKTRYTEISEARTYTANRKANRRSTKHTTTTKATATRTIVTKSDTHRDATLQLAEEIIGALQRAMVVPASAQPQQDPLSPKFSSCSNTVTCQKCQLQVYTVSSCRYVECPRCGVLNLLNAHDPLPVGVGLTYDGLEKILDRGHPTLLRAAAAAQKHF